MSKVIELSDKDKLKDELKSFIKALFDATGEKEKEKLISEEFLDRIDIQVFSAGDEHNPKDFGSLQGKCCCYMFCKKDNGYVYKIGKVTSTNHSRYRSYHYKISDSISSFAKSLRDSGEYEEENIGERIMNDFTRINIMIPEEDALKLSGNGKDYPTKDYENFFLNLLEAALHFKYEPIFEGRCKGSIDEIKKSAVKKS